uniref:Uncharacterized protein n=1 Tax=Elaeophora elaphi TaxID=1147741 RepID=A0A0R3RN19_9BILA
MESEMIAAPTIIHYQQHLAAAEATAAAAVRAPPKPLALTRSALQISLQSSAMLPPQSSSSSTSTSSCVNSASVQKSEKLIAKMCNEIEERIPLRKNMGNVRNDYGNEQLKYYSSQSKSADMTTANSEKFLKQRVTRQASFLAAVSASNSHREIRSVSTHDLRSDLNSSSKESLTRCDTGSTTHLTSHYANTARSNDSSSNAAQRFSIHALESNEIRNYSNHPRHSAYYVSKSGMDLYPCIYSFTHV